MSKPFDKLWNMIRLSDEDDYDDYDDYDEFDDYDDEDDFDDDFDDIPAPVVKKKSTSKPKKEKTPKPQPKTSAKKEKTTSATAKKKSSAFGTGSSTSHSKSTHSNIVPLMGNSKNEVCVLRPTTFEDSRDITDVLLNGKAVVLNLEGIDYEVAQRIIDFISGSCYAMAGNIEKISNYIFIVTPETIDISGDISEVISSGINLDLDF